MSIYNITKGQLIILWIFGVLLWIGDIITFLESYSTSSPSGFLIILIPFILIFYTIGWRKKHKSKKNN